MESQALINSLFPLPNPIYYQTLISRIYEESPHYKKRMVKNSKISREKASRDDEDQIVYSSSFLRPWHPQEDQEIIQNSTPKKIIVPSPLEDNSYIPSTHRYQYFLDYKEAKGPDALLEKPLDQSEIEVLSTHIDKFMQNFNTQLPKPKSKPKDLEYMQKIWPIFSKSEYRTDILDYILEQSKIVIRKSRAENLQSDRKFIKTMRLEVLFKLAQLFYEHYSPKFIAHVMRGHMDPGDVLRFLNIMEGKGIEIIEDLYPVSSAMEYPAEVSNMIVEQAEDPNFRCVSIHDRAITLSEKLGKKVKRSYIRSVLAKHNYSHRQTQAVYPKIDNIGHKNCRLHVIKTLIELLRSGKEMVSVDETQLNRSLTKSHAWAKKSTRLVTTHAEVGGPVHIIAAILKDRVLGYMLRNQRITSYSYKLFLMGVVHTLKEIDPNYREKYFIFMDNATAHKRKMLKDWVELQGITVLCNAAMTPQINPIEYVFSMFKNDLKCRLHTDREMLFVYIYQAFLSIHNAPDKIFNCYVHAFKLYKHILNFKPIFHKKNEFDGREVETNPVAIQNLKEYFQTGKISGFVGFD